MSRLAARFFMTLAVRALAVVGASPLASAQEALPYPGPFVNSGDFTLNATQPLVGADNDNDGRADGSVPDGSSIDANPAGAGLSFVIVDAQPSAGGTGGGDAGAGLAVTGGESELTMALAMGLLAVGGASLVASRRKLSD